MNQLQKRMSIQETLKAIDSVTARLNQLKIPPVSSRSKSKKQIQPDAGGAKPATGPISTTNSVKSIGQNGTGGTHQTNTSPPSLKMTK